MPPFQYHTDALFRYHTGTSFGYSSSMPRSGIVRRLVLLLLATQLAVTTTGASLYHSHAVDHAPPAGVNPGPAPLQGTGPGRLDSQRLAASRGHPSEAQRRATKKRRPLTKKNVHNFHVSVAAAKHTVNRISNYTTDKLVLVE